MTASSPGPVPTLTVSRLPAEVGADARIYLRPVGLAAGNEAEALLASGEARRLTAGPFAFAACQVYLREPGRIRTAVAAVGEIERWATGLPEAARDRVSLLLGRLTGPRRAPPSWMSAASRPGPEPSRCRPRSSWAGSPRS